jgi:hypothetical protein
MTGDATSALVRATHQRKRTLQVLTSLLGKSTVFRTVVRNGSLSDASINLRWRSRARTTVSCHTPDRSWLRCKDVHSTETRPPYLSGEERLTGIASTDPVPSRWLQRRPDA